MHHEGRKDAPAHQSITARSTQALGRLASAATSNLDKSQMSRNGSTRQADPADTQEWEKLSAVIDSTLESERAPSRQRAQHVDAGSDYPGLFVGPEKMPEPGSKDWREMAPPDSPARHEAAATPQTPEEYREALDVVAALRPRFCEQRSNHGA